MTNQNTQPKYERIATFVIGGLVITALLTAIVIAVVNVIHGNYNPHATF